METTRQPRIVIEDLPAEQLLTEEEMAALFGSGRRFTRLGLEPLESRELLASSLNAILAAGTLTIQDSTANDTIRVREINNQISVDGVNIATTTGSLASVAANQVTQIRVLPLGGQDLIDLDSQSVAGQQPLSDQVFIQSGPGNDTVRYGGGKTLIDAANQSIVLQPNGMLSVTPLAAPTLTGPSGSIAASNGYDTPTFTWNSVAGASKYYLYVVDATTGAAVINNPNVTTTSFTPSAGLTPGHNFTWYVGAESSNSAAVAWSGPRNFTLAALAAPTQNGPSGTITAAAGYDTPTFSWISVTGASKYYLYVVDATTGAAVINNPNVTTTSFIASAGLTPGHSFTWYVGAESTNSADVAWSGPRNYTLAALTVPTQNGPSGTIAPASGFDRPTFSWSSVTGASQYYLYVVDATTGVAVINNANITTTSFIASAGLTPGHSITWYIGAEGVNGGGAAFSGPRSFTLVALTAPTQSGPSGAITASTGYDNPTFHWSSVTGATRYSLYVVDATTGAAVINNPYAITTSFAATSGLTPGHNFTWYVGAESTNSADVAWSRPQNFTLAALAAPTLTGPDGTIAVSSGFDTPTFTWSSVVAANRYYVYVVDDSTGALVINNTNVTGTSYTASSPLTPGHNFTWYVGAESTNGGDVAFSGPRNFTLAALAAPTLTDLSGTIAANSGFDTPTFTWNSVVGATHYYVYGVDDSTGAVVVNNASVSDTSFTPSTALTPGHSITWYVGAESTNSADVTWCGPRNFTLAALAAPTQNGPSGTIAAAAGYDTPTFSWISVTGASKYYLYVVDATTGAAVINNPNVATTSFTPSTALTPGHNFTWYVGAASTNSGEITWTSARNFTLAALAAATLTEPSGSIAASTAYNQQFPASAE